MGFCWWVSRVWQLPFVLWRIRGGAPEQRVCLGTKTQVALLVGLRFTLVK